MILCSVLRVLVFLGGKERDYKSGNPNDIYKDDIENDNNMFTLTTPFSRFLNSY